jgi:hypothetical protein
VCKELLRLDQKEKRKVCWQTQQRQLHMFADQVPAYAWCSASLTQARCCQQARRRSRRCAAHAAAAAVACNKQRVMQCEAHALWCSAFMTASVWFFSTAMHVAHCHPTMFTRLLLNCWLEAVSRDNNSRAFMTRFPSMAEKRTPALCASSGCLLFIVCVIVLII